MTEPVLLQPEPGPENNWHNWQFVQSRAGESLEKCSHRWKLFVFFFYVFIIINFFSTQWVTLNLKFSYCYFQSSTGITFLLVFLPCQAILYPQTVFRLAKVSDPEPAYQWGLLISVGIDKFFTKTLHYFFFFLSLEHDIRFWYRYNNLPVTVPGTC